jgi:geranyl-CoA carboxylase beta subunit
MTTGNLLPRRQVGELVHRGPNVMLGYYKDFQANRAGMLALIARDAGLRSARAASARAERFEKRGQLLPRERLALLLDPGAPFLELSTLAGFCSTRPTRRRACRAAASSPASALSRRALHGDRLNDSGIDAGALQPMGLDKQLRVQEIALENKLPSCSWSKAPAPT